MSPMPSASHEPPPGESSPAGEAMPVARAVDFGEARLLPDVDRAHAWLLTVDGAPQSYVDLDDPGHLEFEYARRVGYAIDAALPEGALDAVHLGGGAMTLPRWLAHRRPGSRQHVVEADRALAALVAEQLPPVPGAAVHTADARQWLAGAPEHSADLVIADVFGGARVPAHLTSVECAAEAARVLRPDGLYLANIADAAPFAFLGGQLATLRTAFAATGEVALCVLAEPGVLRGRRYGNAVVVAARRALPLGELVRACAADVFPARVVHGPALAALRGEPVYDAFATPSPEPPDDAFSVG